MYYRTAWVLSAALQNACRDTVCLSVFTLLPIAFHSLLWSDWLHIWKSICFMQSTNNTDAVMDAVSMQEKPGSKIQFPTDTLSLLCNAD